MVESKSTDNMTAIETKVLNANKQLLENGLVLQSFGNASQRIKDNFLIIKPSGINLKNSNSIDMACVDLINGSCVGDRKPSSDTPTHIEIYKNFNGVGGIVHTHSLYATAWAQAAMSIPCLGTTHADYWKGDIPITRDLTKDEINGEYEKETGKVIIEN